MEPVCRSSEVAGIAADPHHAILLDDDPAVLAVLLEALTGCGLSVNSVSTAGAAFEAMLNVPVPSILITDIDLGDGPDGIEVAQHARNLWPKMPIFVLSGRHGCDTSFEARLGARFFSKPVRIAVLLAALAEAVELPTA